MKVNIIRVLKMQNLRMYNTPGRLCKHFFPKTIKMRDGRDILFFAISLLKTHNEENLYYRHRILNTLISSA